MSADPRWAQACKLLSSISVALHLRKQATKNAHSKGEQGNEESKSQYRTAGDHTMLTKFVGAYMTGQTI